jgi:hypothetical protein
MRKANALGEREAEESPIATALYIGTLTEELAHLARRHGLETLGYILDMARLEADQVAKDCADTGRLS